MTLQEKLNGIRSEFEGKTPPEKLAIMHHATDEMRRSGIVERVLKAGDLVPEFLLPNWRGASIGSRELLARGPLVVTFYRGVW
jgi:hypothetical protein